MSPALLIIIVGYLYRSVFVKNYHKTYGKPDPNVYKQIQRHTFHAGHSRFTH